MKITKTTVQATTRKLSASYNKEISQEIEDLFAEELKKEIDNEIQHEIFKVGLTGKNWHIVKVGNPFDNELTDEWLAQNIKHQYRNFGYIFYFESHEDAVLFTMRWS